MPSQPNWLDYNLFQQIYCLSMSANIVSGHEGSEETLQNVLQQSLNRVLPKLPGKWTISWGPKVFKEQNKDSPKGGPDNVWFAAADESKNVCVAIAGTAPHSWADMGQNLGVNKVVDFDAWVRQWSSDNIPKPQPCNPNENDGSTVAYCAKGTCIGAWNILHNPGTAALSNCSTDAAKVMRIDEYLSRLDASHTVVFTGHSLGGVLAPVVALGLRKANRINVHDVKVLASAGVSPGNDKLARDFAETFPSPQELVGTYKVYNTDYYNEFDIVPQAWSISPADDRNLYNILNRILQFSDKLKPWAELLSNIAMGLSRASRIRYVPLPGQGFTGQAPSGPIQSWDDLRRIVGEQHSLAYWNTIGITDFMRLFERTFCLLEGAEAE
ncbi:hypothetical protein GQX73_g9790 [Xylaria multiplex]|uniref:Fungal lipase-type domain-containing protein n=1 Tax=Xylaria multiplex TaxID=323545 RepID=A0A7C8MRI9_9PEZI|nr:hypothetical protein GQX73_g9790 [Xylaria multiplex]